MGNIRRAMAELLPPKELEQGACVTAPLHHKDLFHGTAREQHLARKLYCKGCPVVTECLNHAKRLGPEATEGALWGAQTPRERRWVLHQHAGRTGYRPENTSSGFRGVTWNKRSGAWVAAIRLPRAKKAQMVYLGTFEGSEAGEIEAAKAWDQAAIKYRGKDTWTNFPQEQ